MRYKGLTMSDFTPLLHDDVFKGLNKWFIERNNNKLLVKEDASSRKLKTQQKMISIIKKNSSSQKAVEFQTAIANAKNLTEKKRVYFSDYGFANSREVIRGDEDILVKTQSTLINSIKRTSSNGGRTRPLKDMKVLSPMVLSEKN